MLGRKEKGVSGLTIIVALPEPKRSRHLKKLLFLYTRNGSSRTRFVHSPISFSAGASDIFFPFSRPLGNRTNEQTTTGVALRMDSSPPLVRIGLVFEPAFGIIGVTVTLRRYERKKRQPEKQRYVFVAASSRTSAGPDL